MLQTHVPWPQGYIPRTVTRLLQNNPLINEGWQFLLTPSAFLLLETEPVISEYLMLENSLLWWYHGNNNKKAFPHLYQTRIREEQIETVCSSVREDI